MLAFKLLRNAKLTKQDMLIVLTGVNYDKKDDMYIDAKKSLKKFKGDSASASGSGVSDSSAAIKLEPAWFNEEALAAMGYYRKGNRGSGRGYQSRSYPSTPRSSPIHSPTSRRKPINPPGPDGEPLACHCCKSICHMLRDCPVSYEKRNQGAGFRRQQSSNVKVTSTENVCLFTGYNSVLASD